MDEVVETSDPEELEELRVVCQHTFIPPPTRPSSSDGRQSPRKRPKLHHEYDDIALRTPPRSRSSPSEEALSPRFPTSEWTSPASLTRASSPKPSSPVATPPVSVTDPSVSPYVASRNAEDPFEPHSQDPLLFRSSVSPKIDIRTPDRSPPANRFLSPDSYKEPSNPTVAQPATPSILRSRSESVDPLLLFSPSRPSIHEEAVVRSFDAYSDGDDGILQPGILSSPLSPPPVRSPSPPLGPPSHPDDLAVAKALADKSNRYPLRERHPRQVQPYKYDKADYHNTMRNNKEAIVDTRETRGHHTRRDDYEEEAVQTQELDGYEAENDDEVENDDPLEEQSRHSRRRSKVHSPAASDKPSILPPPLPTSDEEEEREIDALRKEGRKLARKQKEVTGKHGRKKARPFPLKNIDDSNERSASPSRHAPRPNTPAGIRSQKSPSVARPQSHASSRPPSLHPPTPVFHRTRSESSLHNSDVDMEILGNDFFPPSPQVFQNDPGTPIVISDQEDNNSSNASDTDDKVVEPMYGSTPEPGSKEYNEEKKQRRRIRALNRMYPAVMRHRMMKDDVVSVKRSAKRQRSASVPSDNDEPLLPGQTRVRKAEHPPNLRDIKGDTESSDDQVVENKGDESLSANDEPTASDMDVEVIPPRKQRTRHVSLQNSSDEELLFGGRIDDESIDVYLKEAHLCGSGLQEKDMIDWMLANTAEIGGTRRAATRVKSAKAPRFESPRPKISITTGGARKEHQTMLSFKPSNRGRPRDRRRRSSGGAAPAPREGHKRVPVHHTTLVFDRSPSPSQQNLSSYSSPEGAIGDDMLAFDVEEGPPSPPANLRGENVHQMPHPAALRKAALKQKKKERKAREKMHGVYIFPAPKGSRIAGQRVKGVTVHVDDRFHHALAPIRKRQQPAPPAKSTKAYTEPRAPSHKAQRAPAVQKLQKRDAKGKNRRLLPRGERPIALVDYELDDARQESPNAEQVGMPPVVAEQDLLLDFGISLHGSMIRFAGDTYTGKGRLNELINPPEVPPGSHFCSAHGFDMGSHVTAPQFLATFGQICDRLYEFSTRLPDNDEEKDLKNWTSLLGATCRVVTSLLAAGEESKALKDEVERQILRLTSRMCEASLTAASIDSTAFTICWFTVEMSVRSGFKLPASCPSEPNVLQEACTVLVKCLVEYGLERGMEPLVTGTGQTTIEIDGSTTTHRAFEAWVGIWHITDKYADPAAQTNPLWKMVQTALAARQTASNMSDLEASETVWRAIIGLSTISQSSPRPRGLTEAASDTPCRLACWDIVLFALERIRLEANAEADEGVSESAFDARDRYITLVVERCCRLWSRWRWAAEDAVNVLHRLLAIFRSRKFANLRHEKAEFSDFLRINDWGLLSRRIHSESTFVLLLKLVYQTLLVSESQVKKLLSLATPVGSLPWTKAQPPSSVHDLSMLFNRLTVIAIATYIEPLQHARWIQLARGYVKFKDADATTRHAHIRGWMYLSIAMVRRSIQLDEALGWLNEMVTILLGEYKVKTGSVIVLGILTLVGSVRNVICEFKSNKSDEPSHGYPDPRLILSLEHILQDRSLVKEGNASALIVPRLIRSFLSVRELAVPPPKRPPFPLAVAEQESQDEYGALALDEDLIADLDQASLRHETECKERDLSLCKLFDTHVCWTLFRQFGQYARVTTLKDSLQNNDAVSSDIASLAGCWLGCANIVVQNSVKVWSMFVDVYVTGIREKTQENGVNLPPLDTFCVRRLDFLVFSNVLMLDPMSYLLLKDNFLTVLFESLASWHTTTEDDYIKLLLSIDGHQHPLLKGAVWDPSAEKDEVSILTARLPLVTAILDNLSDCLAAHDEDTEPYVGYCLKMFLAMQNVHTELEKDAQAQKAYASWCLQVYGICQTRPSISTQTRFQTAWLKFNTISKPVYQNNVFM